MSPLEAKAMRSCKLMPRQARNAETIRRMGIGAVIVAGPYGYRASASLYVIGPLRETKAAALEDLDRLDREGSALVGDPAFDSWAAHAFREGGS